jgi:hypothetical protein
VVQACGEFDSRNTEIVPSDPKISDPLDISVDEDYQQFKDYFPTLSRKGTTTNPSVTVDSILPPCEQVDSRKGNTFTSNSDPSMPTSVLLEYVDQPPSLNPEQAPAKRPKLDRDYGLSKDDTSVPSAANYSHQRDLKGQEGQQQAQTDNADVSKESSDSEAVKELESSGSVYVETSLDKMMDCLTKFKYAVQRLKSSHLLLTIDDSDSIVVESIVSCYEQLEHLYEDMEECL